MTLTAQPRRTAQGHGFAVLFRTLLCSALLAVAPVPHSDAQQPEFVRVGASSTVLRDGITGLPTPVRTRAFLIAVEELSQRSFEQVMGYNPSRHLDPDLPVHFVSWQDAIAYCNRRSLAEGLRSCYDNDGEWLRNCDGYRLPTEAEWLAAAGTEESPSPESLADAYLFRGTNSVEAATASAAQGPKPARHGLLFPQGTRNQWGNVWEWCYDRFHASRIVEQVDNPAGPLTGHERVLRGGSFLTPPASWNKGFRSSMPPATGSAYVGFRLARSLPSPADAAPDALPEGLLRVEAAADSMAQAGSTTRSQWLEMLGAPRLPAQPVEAQLREQLEEPAWRGRLFDLVLEPGLPCRALLMLPAMQPGDRVPVVLVPFYDVDTPAGKDLGGRNAMPAGVRAFAHVAVQHGMAALAVRWHGENDGPAYLEVVAELERRHPGVTGLGYWVWQAQRLVDWLEAQPEIDARRIGIAGHSLGGKMALYAGAFEPRFRAVLSSEPGIALEFSNYSDSWYLDGRRMILPQSADHHDLLRTMAPRSFLLIAGESADGVKSLPLLREAAAAYPLGNTNQPFAPGIFFLNHGAGHSPTPESVIAGFAWLQGQLRANPAP